MKETLRPGMSHTMTYQVPPHRTVPHLLPESPDFVSMPEVLATGYLVGVIEWACIESLHGHLDDGEITLGTHVDVSHQAATVPGSTVTVQVSLTDVDRRALVFAVTASDESAVISTGTHKRVVVDRERFVAKLGRPGS
ncbi:thioesterase family protein [Tessaracoccus sp. Z1128]